MCITRVPGPDKNILGVTGNVIVYVKFEKMSRQASASTLCLLHTFRSFLGDARFSNARNREAANLRAPRLSLGPSATKAPKILPRLARARVVPKWCHYYYYYYSYHR